MIIIGLIGRLGNQMFQYAFAYNTAKKLKTRFIFRPIYKNEITKYFKLDVVTHILYSKYGYKLYSRYLDRKKGFEVLEQNGWQNKTVIQNKSEYAGFFQSELFFQESENSIRKKFDIKNKWKKKFVSKYRRIFSENKIIVVHIRRTDYVDYGSDELGGTNMCLPMSYYNNCLDQIKNIDNYKIICISDDIAFAEANLSKRKNVTFESNEVIVDYQLMLNADILIIANSSFAWWAAYLNEKPNKIVYSPKYWIGFKVDKEYPLSITPPSFTPIDVY